MRRWRGRHLEVPEVLFPKLGLLSDALDKGGRDRASELQRHALAPLKQAAGAAKGG